MLTKNQIIRLITLTLVLGLVSTSCRKLLEAEVVNEITFEEFAGTPEKAQEMLVGAYGGLCGGAFLGGQVQNLAEIMSDNIAEKPATNNGNYAAVYSRTTDIFLDVTRSVVREGGYAIGRANLLIDSIDVVQGLEAAERTRLIAEAKFVRAVAHWELVKMFAQPYGYTADNSHPGVPVRTTFTTAPIDRATVGEVYTQVIQDLQDAANDLPETNGGFATRYAAEGYLAKIYFQMNNFEEAFRLSNQVLATGLFPLDTSLTGRLSDVLTSEAIFQSVATNQNNAGGALYFAYRVDPNSELAGLSLSADMAGQLLIGDDKRGQRWVNQSDPYFWCAKIQDTARQPLTQVPLVHATELMLIRAESAAETGGDPLLAIEDLNAILDRAGLNTLANGTDAATIIRVARDERRKELVIEGNRLHELKRIAVLENPNLEIRGAPWDCAGMVFQFPDSELAGNLNLEPNPEGGCN